MALRVCLASDSSQKVNCTCLQCGAGTACCAKLAAAKFSSNLPVLIVDTGGKQFDRSIAKAKLPVNVCSCGAPSPGQDYAYNVEMSYRGGVNSSALLRGPSIPSVAGCVCFVVLRECSTAEHRPIGL